MSGRARWNPFAGVARSWGHFVRRPRPTQLRTVGDQSWRWWPASSSGGDRTVERDLDARLRPVRPRPTSRRERRSTPVSSGEHLDPRGDRRNRINVVFPVVSLNSLAGQEGFAADPEYGEQTKAIDFYVSQVNHDGGINGRSINPIVVCLRPDERDVDASVVQDVDRGSPAAFAVIDGIGAWTGDNQLCVTQEGHTPFIGEWSTVTNWTDQGSPYLWWTGRGPRGHPPGGRGLGGARP